MGARPGLVVEAAEGRAGDVQCAEGGPCGKAHVSERLQEAPCPHSRLGFL